MPNPSHVIAALAIAAASAGVPTGCGPGAPPSKPAMATPIPTEPEQLHRLYDFTPVSASNPVVAQVIGTPIVIPMSELRAHLKAEVSEEDRQKLDAKGRRQHVERVIDELTLLWEAYQQGVDKKDPVAAPLASTRRLLLGEMLTKQEVGDKAKTAEEYAALGRALEDGLFEKVPIVVSNEGYDALKVYVARYGRGRLEDFPPDKADEVLAQFGDETVSIGDFFALYVSRPVNRRPDVRNGEVFSALLRELTAEGLKVHEARALRLDKTRAYRELVEANRASLTRMVFQDQIREEATQRMKAPETSGRLRQWYEDHRTTRYTYRDAKGVEQTRSFEAQKETVANDYLDVLRQQVRAERAQRARKGFKVEIDEGLAAGA